MEILCNDLILYQDYVFNHLSRSLNSFSKMLCLKNRSILFRILQYEIFLMTFIFFCKNYWLNNKFQ